MVENGWDIHIKTSIKNGDKDAFRLLYEKFYSGLCVLAQRYTGSPDVAEEIVQDAFMRIWESRDERIIRGSLHSYLYASVRNGSLNYLKHRLIERKYSDERQKHLERTINLLLISQENGSSILIAEEMDKTLHAALESLPPKCREIFLLHREKGFSYAEVAGVLGLSKNTVQRQVSIALEKLREKLLPHIR
jgi:RNA polymerase sigma-70 factor, ECF subfamily